VALSAVRFHYFAGFGGGPKMVVPGLAGRETIRRNHARVLGLAGAGIHPGCREGSLRDNPVWQDLADAARRVGPIFGLQLALAGGGRIAGACGGLLLEAQQRLLPMVRKLEETKIDGPRDVVVASAGGFPADIDLVQSHKAIHHAFRAVRRGGMLIVLAECASGIGSPTLGEWLGVGDASTIAARMRDHYQLNSQTALSLRLKAEAVRLVLVSQLDPAIVRRAGMLPATSLEEAWRLAGRGGERPRSGFIMPQAGATVPGMNEEEP
jgi:lactate racemase